MPSPHRFDPLPTLVGRAVATLLTALGMIMAGALVVPVPAIADQPESPDAAGSFHLSGAGYGHGWGMSQYGAYGAATKGKTWKQILSFYYSGTTLDTQSSKRKIRVWISADDDGALHVLPSEGLQLHQRYTGKIEKLPTGDKYRLWRVSRSGNGFALSYRNADGDWVRHKIKLKKGAQWAFENKAKKITVSLPDASHRVFRGKVYLAKDGKGGRTINRLTYKNYLRSVVPSEIPTSWNADAVRAQAVAARSFAARTQAGKSSSSSYDVCDTTVCQMYKGYSTTVGSVLTEHETDGGNAAVKATAGKILKHGSKIALTQFSSSNGGHTAQGDFPYLKAKSDPYDGLIESASWSTSLSASAIGSAYPSVGTVRGLKITERDGNGKYGGRVTSIKIIGSDQTATVSGANFSTVFGLRSTLFKVSASASSTNDNQSWSYSSPPWPSAPESYLR